MHPFIVDQLIAVRRAEALADVHHSRLVRAAITTRPAVAQSPVRGRWRRRLSIGTLAVVAALGAFAGSPAESSTGPSTARPEAERITLVGLPAGATERVTYEPGASRSWVQQSQVVGVTVVSGRLTVYGTDGARWVYTAGDGFAAGWAAYRTANETDAPVVTLVTSHASP